MIIVKNGNYSNYQENNNQTTGPIPAIEFRKNPSPNKKLNYTWRD